MEIMAWGTHSRLHGRVQERLDDYSFVTNAVLIKRDESF